MMGRTLVASVGLGLLFSGCSLDVDEIVGFRVVAATPGVIQAGDTSVPWRVNGTGFEAGATVSVDAVEVTVANVVVVDENEITFELTALNTLAQGTANVTVTNPDMESRSTSVSTIPENVTLSGSVQPIFDSHCVTCHSGGTPAAGLDLSTGNAHGAIVGVASSGVPAMNLIEAGDAGNSYLLQKVAGIAAVGAPMPPNAAPLSNTQIALMAAWTDAGALDD